MRVALLILVAWTTLCWVAPAWSETHLIVGTAAQGGQYTSVQAAVDAVPGTPAQPNSERYIIDIRAGTYQERVHIPSHKPLITLRGQDPSTTTLTYFEHAGTPPNEPFVHASTVVLGRDFVAENLTFANSHGPGSQALAIYVKADRSLFHKVRFLGWQDTLRAELGRQYYHQVHVEGSVDFIYGKGTAYFEDSTLFAKSNGYVTAQGRETAAETNGYVFKNSTVTGTAPNGSVFLGRPWQQYARVVFLNSRMGPQVPAAGWSAWSGNNNHLTAYFAEYNSLDLAGNPLDVSGRVSWSHQLTAAQAQAFSKQAWLGGSDGWNPVLNLPGDFDYDGTYDCQDIDSLVREAYVAAHVTLFDLTGDDLVNGDDVTAWRAAAGAVMFGPGRVVPLGDANLDGAVDGSDFNIWNAHKFTIQPAWCSGDFNADGAVDGADFNLWNANKFTSAADRPESVPEPTYHLLPWLILALTGRR